MTTTELNELAKNIAHYIPEISQVELPEGCCPRLHLTSGGYFTLRGESHLNNKVECSANLHLELTKENGETRSEYYGNRWFGPDGKIPHPSICFDSTKGALKVARDIKRRFLGAFVKAYGMAKEFRDLEQARINGGKSIRQQIEAAVGSMSRELSDSREFVIYVKNESGSSSSRLECRPDAPCGVNVKLDKHLTVEKALALIEFLKTL